LTYLVNSGDQLYQILCNKVNGTKQRVWNLYCEAGRPVLGFGQGHGTVEVQIGE